jgi:hypothetical protein
MCARPWALGEVCFVSEDRLKAWSWSSTLALVQPVLLAPLSRVRRSRAGTCEQHSGERMGGCFLSISYAQPVAVQVIDIVG